MTVIGGRCDVSTCDQKATKRRTLTIGISAYGGYLCDEDGRNFNRVWTQWRRLSQDASNPDLLEVAVKCNRCDCRGTATRWWELDGHKRVSRLCTRCMHAFDHDVAIWAGLLLDVTLDAVLTTTGRVHAEIATEVIDRGQKGRSSTRDMRYLMNRHRQANRNRPMPVYVEAPPELEATFGDWHFVDQVAYDKVVSRGLNPVLVVFAAVYPATRGFRFEGSSVDLTVHTRGEGDEMIRVVVNESKSEIVDAFSPGAWEWAQRHKWERVTA